MKRFCACLLWISGLSAVLADDWPQWFGPKRDGVWRESGIVESFPDGGPPLLWKQEIGAGYAGPAVSEGKVFLFSRKLGEASALPGNPFERGEIPGEEILDCFDAKTGKRLWSQAYATAYTVSYAAGPRCTPVVDQDRVYTLGAEGRLRCWKVADGALQWEKDFVSLLGIKTAMWGFAATPLIDGDQLICLAGGEGSTVMAFDKLTGEERWRALASKEPGYCPPTMIEDEGRRVLVIWHPESINGLDPQTGKVFWTVPWEIRSGLSVATPQRVRNQLFLTCFYNGSTLLDFERFDREPKVVWQTERASERRTEHLNSIMATPVIDEGHIYGGCSYGQFRCLQLTDGKRLWETLEPIVKKEERWGNVFVTPHKDRYFLFNELGELIIAKLSPEKYEEISRAKLIEPNGGDMKRRPIVWSHPAYAQQCIFVRNDSEIRCYSLKAES